MNIFVTWIPDEVSAELLNDLPNFGEKNTDWIQTCIFRLPYNVVLNKIMLKIIVSLNFMPIALCSAK